MNEQPTESSENKIEDLEITGEEAAEQVAGGNDRRKAALDPIQKNLDMIHGMNPQI